MLQEKEHKRKNGLAGQELAERYATVTMLKSPVDTPFAAAPVLALFCSIENYNEDDSRSDHPAGVRRIKAMFDSAQNSEQWKKMWALANPAQRQTIQAMLDQLADLN